jgi:histidinol-phosphate aminotransferase
MAGAIAAIEDEAWFEANRAQVMKSRKTLSDALQNIGFEVLDSKANFLFVRHRSHDAAKLAQGLRQKNILVRHFAKAGIDQFLRISIGDEDQCQALILALHILISAEAA